MSGTSLDGIDFVCSDFIFNKSKWEYEISFSETFKYDDYILNKLRNSHSLNGFELTKLDIELGHYIGGKANEFIKKNNIKANFISSHGHTIFHQPEKGITLQIGNANPIAYHSGLLTVSDFRTFNVILNGQGAPLVPIGDKYLFSDYDYCINLGGFSNISYDLNNQRIAFDICPVNIVANQLSLKKNLLLDLNGEMGSKGEICNELLLELNNIDFYNIMPPKSLGKEWVDNKFFPIFNKYNICIEDSLSTLYEHIAIQIGNICNNKNKSILFTGGGVYNKYLMSRIEKYVLGNIIVPNKEIIEYKEALIFAFLGLLRILKKENVCSTYTGSISNNCAGNITLPLMK